MLDRRAIYFTAKRLPAENRLAYLTKACEGDSALRARVEEMLAVTDRAEAFIADLPDTEPVAKTLKIELLPVPDAIVGEKIGRYKILEKVGEGGCGVVYVAEQSEPVRQIQVRLEGVFAGAITL